ncbi:hypothetical protein DQ04_05911060 [Trypanosoma grayi]|uniref:hypothetical protein n=1 Tax=Trypanosoma grayi TaxID=71804 RepID=UPI0004F44EA3|nr:hypothetical protein DQ04_05911060 [Trypanosoma grayi]KEG09056.1 hypothetical protein DQ04_05911060 [Trypanosoma grayi]
MSLLMRPGPLTMATANTVTYVTALASLYFKRNKTAQTTESKEWLGEEECLTPKSDCSVHLASQNGHGSHDDYFHLTLHASTERNPTDMGEVLDDALALL